MQSHIQTQTSGSIDASLLNDEVRAQGLTDDALSEAGLVKISAFIRNEQSANAKRVQKARKKAATSGMRQVNVVAPPAAHETIKALASQLQAGCNTRVALERLLYAEVRKSAPDAVVRVVSTQELEVERRATRHLAGFRGWRRVMAKLLGLI